MSSLLHDPFIQFLINAALVIIFGIAATILTALTIKQARSKKEISYEIVSQAPVVSVDEKMANRVKILLDGKEIEKPYLTVIKFTSSGNKAIAENDFVDPITIDFKGSQIVSAEIIETKPEKYFTKTQDKEDFIQWKGTEAALKKKFLNPGNQFVISTLIEKKTQGIDINGVIVEGIIKKKSETHTPLALIITFPIYILVCILYGVEVYNMFVLKNTINEIIYLSTSFIYFLVAIIFSLLLLKAAPKLGRRLARSRISKREAQQRQLPGL